MDLREALKKRQAEENASPGAKAEPEAKAETSSKSQDGGVTRAEFKAMQDELAEARRSSHRANSMDLDTMRKVAAYDALKASGKLDDNPAKSVPNGVELSDADRETLAGMENSGILKVIKHHLDGEYKSEIQALRDELEAEKAAKQGSKEAAFQKEAASLMEKYPKLQDAVGQQEVSRVQTLLASGVAESVEEAVEMTLKVPNLSSFAKDEEPKKSERKSAPPPADEGEASPEVVEVKMPERKFKTIAEGMAWAEANNATVQGLSDDFFGQ